MPLTSFKWVFFFFLKRYMKKKEQSITKNDYLLYKKIKRIWSSPKRRWKKKETYPQIAIEKSVQFSSVVQSCPSLCDPIDCSTPGFPVHHQLSEFTQTYVRRVGDAIQPYHPLSSSSPPALDFSQHQGLYQWVSFSYPVAKVLEFQL